MLPRYEPNFDALTHDQAYYLAQALEIADLPGDPISGHDLYEICAAASLDQADTVMALADDPSVTAVLVMEALIGKPIQRAADPARPPVERGRRASPGPRPRRGAPDPRVIIYVRPNPKKAGSAPAQRYDAYRVGMTVDEAIAAGMLPADIVWDSAEKRDFIRLADPSSPEAEAARSQLTGGGTDAEE